MGGARKDASLQLGAERNSLVERGAHERTQELLTRNMLQSQLALSCKEDSCWSGFVAIVCLFLDGAVVVCVKRRVEHLPQREPLWQLPSLLHEAHRVCLHRSALHVARFSVVHRCSPWQLPRQL